MVKLAGAGDRHDVVALAEHPGQRQLRRRHPLLGGKPLERCDEGGVGLKIFRLEARHLPAEIVGGEIVGLADRPRQEAAAERAVGHETDAEFAAGGKHVLFGIAGPERIFTLQRCDRMDRLRPADGGAAGFREAERANFAFPHQLGHDADSLLDRHVGVDPVLVEQVDGLDAETFQRSLGNLSDMFGAAVDAGDGGSARLTGIDLEAEFGGDHHTIAERLQRLSEKNLVGKRAVDLGSVEEGDAEIDGAMERPDRFRFVTGAIGKAHAHAAEADGGDGQIISEFTGLHDGVPLLS